MPNEIERKFIVSHIPNDLANKKITQGYLQSEKHRTVRIRIVNDSSNNETAYLTIKGKSNFKSTAKDILITSQLKTALIFNKLTKASNYTIDTIEGKIYIFGIAMTKDEKEKVLSEADQIHGVKDVIPSIYLVEELSLIHI